MGNRRGGGSKNFCPLTVYIGTPAGKINLIINNKMNTLNK